MKLALVFGVLVVLGGASIILSAFHIHVPFLRVAVGVAFTWVGVSLVLAAAGIESRWLAFRGPQGTTKAVATAEVGASMFRNYDVFFASSTLDLTELRPRDRVKINVVFGEATVRYDPKTPLEFKSTTAFGSTEYPDGSNIAFGERVIRTEAGLGASRDDIAIVQIATVFGTAHLEPSKSAGPSTLVPADVLR